MNADQHSYNLVFFTHTLLHLYGPNIGDCVVVLKHNYCDVEVAPIICRLAGNCAVDLKRDGDAISGHAFRQFEGG
jgi:hypothetical protein